MTNPHFYCIMILWIRECSTGAPTTVKVEFNYEKSMFTESSIAVQNYVRDLNNLQQIYDRKGPRAAANASGDLFEHLVDDIVSLISQLKSLKNDYLTAHCLNESRDNVQVDRHIRTLENILKIAVECKAYLDASYCMRAVANFIEISRASDSDVKFVLFCGQKSIAESTLRYYQALCKEATGRSFELFVVNDIKKRDSKKPIYREKFSLDLNELNRFYEYISNSITQ